MLQDMEGYEVLTTTPESTDLEIVIPNNVDRVILTIDRSEPEIEPGPSIKDSRLC